MDLTPEALRKVDFKGTFLASGYSRIEVDEFVEKVAAGIEELLEQLKSATERAAAAEAVISDAKTSDETVQRTLVHAQKLADAVLAEARQEATKVANEASESANMLRARAREEGAAHVAKAREARADAERLSVEAEADRRKARDEVDALIARATEGIDADLRAEVERLHGVRSTLAADVETLTTWLESQRTSLRQLLTDAIGVLDFSPLPVDEVPVIEPVDPKPRILADEHPVIHGEDQLDTVQDEAAASSQPAPDDRPTAQVSAIPPEEEPFAPDPAGQARQSDDALLAELRAARKIEDEPPAAGDQPRSEAT